jgi:hypothetical protein
MKALILPFALWAGALQAVLPNQGSAELYSAAAALASLTVMIYRLGVWRQEMANIKHNVGAEVSRFRQESAEQFARLENRFGAFERFVESTTEHRVSMERWQGRVDTTLEAIDESLMRLGYCGSVQSLTARGIS